MLVYNENNNIFGGGNNNFYSFDVLYWEIKRKKYVIPFI
jgi:hypothetical protein